MGYFQDQWLTYLETHADREQQVEVEAQEGIKERNKDGQNVIFQYVYTHKCPFYIFLNAHVLINAFALLILFIMNANVSDKTDV